MSIYTKTNAVNTMLRGISIAPVPNTDDPDDDVGMALQTLDQVSFDIQSRGWWFNKESNWQLTPDPISGEVSVPSAAIDILAEGSNRGNGLVIRNNVIYDTLNHTNDLTSRVDTDGKINLQFIFYLTFEQLPPVAKNLIAYVARRQFAQDQQVDKDRWSFQKRDEEDAWKTMQRMEAVHKRRNQFSNNAVMNEFINRVGGPNARAFNRKPFD